MQTISFIIPVKPDGNILALYYLKQIPTTFSFEIIVSEGNQPSRQRNLASRMATGDILYFLDDDSRISIKSITTCLQNMNDSAVAAIGGPSLTPADDSILQKLFGAALCSLFGAGAVRNRYQAVGVTRTTTERELILCNLAIRKKIFHQFGEFNERLYPNEENELLEKFTKNGLQLIHAPEMAIHRSQRTTLSKFIRQLFGYGCGRGQQTLISKKISLTSCIPLLFIIYLVTLCFTPLMTPYILPLVFYGILSICFAIESMISSKLLVNIILFALFPVMHCANGCGLLYGLLRGQKVNNSATRKPEISVRRVKTFEQNVW